jgi:ABC-type enterochelin transport system substrate-binding protein
VAQRSQLTADWRASFAKPKPEPSAIRAYIAATKAVGAAKAAAAGAVERAQSEAKQVTTKGQPLSFDINTTYLDALCAALEHPSRVYRATPRRADMLRRLGIEVEVVYQVPERIAYLAQAPNSRDTETDGDLYIRMRVPA